jgi:hypothetical protein
VHGASLVYGGVAVNMGGVATDKGGRRNSTHIGDILINRAIYFNFENMTVLL